MRIGSVEIEDFLSIKSLSYSFQDGLHLFTGNNGAGKSTILQALQVSLFNKCERPMPWGRLSGPGGFVITTYFTDINGSSIQVINNRRNNRFEVYENSVLQTHQISKGLPMVAKMLNLTYQEFSMLSYLTPSTVSGILTGTDTSLISKFFSLHVLKDYDASLREERKLLTRDKRAIEGQLADVVTNSKVYDIEELKKNLATNTLSIAEMKTSSALSEIQILESDIFSTKNSLRKNEELLRDKRVTLTSLYEDTGICPTCGNDLKEDATAKLFTIKTLEATILELETYVVIANKELGRFEEDLLEVQIPYISAIQDLEEKLRVTNSELLAASILEERDTVDTDKLNGNLINMESKIRTLTVGIEAIKSGDVHKNYLQTFTSVLNTNLGNLKVNLNISMRVLAKIDSQGLSFSIIDDGVYKFSDVLSSGEKVIVGLMVLSAMFSTLGETLNIKLNVLMLDEAIAAVSTENMEVVEKLLKSLANEKCVIVTQHHEEIKEELFDTHSIIQKIDGLTEIN